MRRSDREITDFDELVDIMRSSDICRLAINTDGAPYIIPLNFGMSVDGDTIELYFHGANEGTKYDLLEKDPYVSFEMDCSHQLYIDEVKGMCTMLYRSVIGEGFVEDVPVSERKLPLRLLLEHYGRGDLPLPDDMVAMTRVLKLTVKKMTGKSRML